MDQINSVGPIQDGQGLSQPSRTQPSSATGPSFKDTLNGFIKDVNAMQVKADESIKKMAAGEITDVHQVMAATEEANVAFNLMMEMRNKVMDAYQEVLRMRL